MAVLGTEEVKWLEVHEELKEVIKKIKQFQAKNS